MLICGIDPGLNVTGYGLVAVTPKGVVLKGTGYVRTSARDPLPRRLEQIHRTLKRTFARTKPQAIVLEKLYAHYRHPLTASLLGHARGVIAMLAQECAIQYFEYPATRVKKAVTGKGHASKRQVQRMIEHMLGVNAEALGPADITDAIGLALTHALVTNSSLATESPRRPARPFPARMGGPSTGRHKEVFRQRSARNCFFAVATRGNGASRQKCKPKQTAKNFV